MNSWWDNNLISPNSFYLDIDWNQILFNIIISMYRCIGEVSLCTGSHSKITTSRLIFNYKCLFDRLGLSSASPCRLNEPISMILCATLKLLYLIYKSPMLNLLILAEDSPDSTLLLPSILSVLKILPNYQSTRFLLTVRTTHFQSVQKGLFHSI